MRGLGLLAAGSIAAASACGGRTAVELAPPGDDVRGAQFGGAPGSGGSSATPGTGANAGNGPGPGKENPGGTGGVTSAGTGPGGSGNTAGAASMLPKGAIGVSSGVDMSCAVGTDDSVWCWGENDQGQLGDGTTTRSSVPVRVAGLTNAVWIAAGGTWNTDAQGLASRNAFACALLGDHTVRCWGNISNVVPSAGVPSSPVPLAVEGINGATQLAAGDYHLCALLFDGHVSCLGDNTGGELGTAELSAISEPLPPMQVVRVSSATAVTGKGSVFSCAVLGDHSVSCWGGLDGFNDLTLGAPPDTDSPRQVPRVLATAGGLSGAYNHVCALAPDHSTVQCWGDNEDGELGTGMVGVASGPVTVQGLGSPVVSVSAGKTSSCAVLADGTVQCWGDHAQGGGSLTPVAVPGLTGVVTVSLGYSEACALTGTGSVRCWNGRVGVDASAPVTMIGP